MKIKTIKVYSFDELSEEAKEKALQNWRNDNDMSFLKDEMEERLSELLKENKIEGKGKCYYSLGYCQGDGAMFTGQFEWKSYSVDINHSGPYNHRYSKIIDISSLKTENDAKEEVYSKFESIYQSICKDLEDYGYSIIEKEESEENIKEIFLINEYTFRENGKMENI